MRSEFVGPGRRSAPRAVVVRGLAVVLLAGSGLSSGCGKEAAAPPPVDCGGAVISPASRVLFPGDTVRFVAVVASCAGVEPVLWFVSNPQVAYIVQADNTSVLVKAVALGTTSVVAQARSEPAVKAAGLVTVTRIGTAPPNLLVRTSTRVVPVAGAPSGLEVSVTLKNPTAETARVGSGPQCPAIAVIHPSGFPIFPLSGTCAAEPSIVLAPGDSIVLTRLVPGDTLANIGAGTYDLSLDVPTSVGTAGTRIGPLALPLPLAP